MPTASLNRLYDALSANALGREHGAQLLRLLCLTLGMPPACDAYDWAMRLTYGDDA
jgi:hypothetical protein